MAIMSVLQLFNTKVHILHEGRRVPMWWERGLSLAGPGFPLSGGIQDPGGDRPTFQGHSLAHVHKLKPGAQSSRNVPSRTWSLCPRGHETGVAGCRGCVGEQRRESKLFCVPAGRPEWGDRAAACGGSGKHSITKQSPRGQGAKRV